MEMTKQQAEKITRKAIENNTLSWIKQAVGRRTIYRALKGDIWVFSYREPLDETQIIELGYGEKTVVPLYTDLVGISLVDTDRVSLGSYEERGEFGFPRNGMIIKYEIEPVLGPAGKLYEHVSNLEKRTREEAIRESSKQIKRRLEDAVRSL